MALGYIVDIQRMSVRDGPGIRTVIFLKGCPLSCIWCHNPEGIDNHIELAYYKDICTLCGMCADLCGQKAIEIEPGNARNFQRNKCVLCGKCIENCPNAALEKVGRFVSVSDAMREMLRDKVFYEESGGGEPELQHEFSMQLLREARKHHIHTCIETCGYGDVNLFCSLAGNCDIVLFDWKESNPILHKGWTGVDNILIRKNLRAIDEKDVDIVLRCPIIPGLNNRKEHICGIAAIANELAHCKEIHLMTYHPYGQSKYARLL
ncbi:MAG TPA: glycyl-radical enzyme activating protein [Candidatus Hydrogenedentes bacterium]|nr:glycyl-radical enzyme activating protein [Candidatus Hydrogenedentota bacterium]